MRGFVEKVSKGVTEAPVNSNDPWKLVCSVTRSGVTEETHVMELSEGRIFRTTTILSAKYVSVSTVFVPRAESVSVKAAERTGRS